MAKPPVDPEVVDQLAAMRRAGATLKELGAEFGISGQGINARLKRAGFDTFGFREGISTACERCGRLFEPTARLAAYDAAGYWRTSGGAGAGRVRPYFWRFCGCEDA